MKTKAEMEAELERIDELTLKEYDYEATAELRILLEELGDDVLDIQSVIEMALKDVFDNPTAVSVEVRERSSNASEEDKDEQ